MNTDIQKARELSYISKLSGQDERLVQAGGGNTSVKLDDHYMLVKASGFQLTDVTESSGFALVDHKAIQDIFRSGNVPEDMEQKILSDSLVEGPRPSIETFLHSVTYRYTIHTHPLGVTIFASREGGMEALQELFPEAVTVDYATPGIKLAKKYYEAVAERQDRHIIFLKNHGLLVSADTLEETVRLQLEVVNKVDAAAGLDTKAVETGQRLFAALQKIVPGSIAYRVETPAAEEAVRRSTGAWEHAYSPDCVVYCGSRIAYVNSDPEAELTQFIRRYGALKAVCMKGYLFAVAENLKKARDIACMLDFSAKIFLSGGTKCPLPEEERNFLLGWDSEKYRATLK